MCSLVMIRLYAAPSQAGVLRRRLGSAVVCPRGSYGTHSESLSWSRRQPVEEWLFGDFAAAPGFLAGPTFGRTGALP